MLSIEISRLQRVRSVNMNNLCEVFPSTFSKYHPLTGVSCTHIGSCNRQHASPGKWLRNDLTISFLSSRAPDTLKCILLLINRSIGQQSLQCADCQNARVSHFEYRTRNFEQQKFFKGIRQYSSLRYSALISCKLYKHLQPLHPVLPLVFPAKPNLRSFWFEQSPAIRLSPFRCCIRSRVFPPRSKVCHP